MIYKYVQVVMHSILKFDFQEKDNEMDNTNINFQDLSTFQQ